MPLLALRIATLALTVAPAVARAQSHNGECVEVFTTAMDSELRLAPGGGIQLLPARQPTETDVAILVATERRFQTLLGIGAAPSLAVRAPVPARYPLENAHWRLKPPQGPSRSRTSPQR